MKVVIDKRVLANFRKRAWRKWPKEHMEALFGRRLKNEVHITVFYHFPHRGTVWHCTYELDEIERLREEASQLGLEYLGAIHTHTGLKTCEHMSEMDHQTSLADGDVISGILYLTKAGQRRSRINFYIPSEKITIDLR